MQSGSAAMIPAEEALQIVPRVAQRLPPVSVPLHEALGKVLAEDITAPDPLPPYPASIKENGIYFPENIPSMWEYVRMLPCYEVKFTTTGQALQGTAC